MYARPMSELLVEVIAALRVAILPFDNWQLDAPRGVPIDVVSLADPSDPLAQSRLWESIYTEIPRGFLVETCMLESGCRAPIGVHADDAHLGEPAWRGVWQRARVAHDCAFYPDPSTVDDSWFPNASTRGNHGLIAAYHVRLLGPCVPLEALDVPFFSAWAAAEKARRACASMRAQGRKCTRERLRCVWAHAELGGRACRKVVRRFRDGLAKIRKNRPEIDTRARYTLTHFRRNPHAIVQ